MLILWMFFRDMLGFVGRTIDGFNKNYVQPPLPALLAPTQYVTEKIFVGREESGVRQRCPKFDDFLHTIFIQNVGHAYKN